MWGFFMIDGVAQIPGPPLHRLRSSIGLAAHHDLVATQIPALIEWPNMFKSQNQSKDMIQTSASVASSGQGVRDVRVIHPRRTGHLPRPSQRTQRLGLRSRTP